MRMRPLHLFPQATWAVVMALALVLPASGKALRIETIASVPFGFIDTDGNPTGIMYEISNRIAEEAGLPYTNKIIPTPGRS